MNEDEVVEEYPMDINVGLYNATPKEPAEAVIHIRIYLLSDKIKAKVAEMLPNVGNEVASIFANALKEEMAEVKAAPIDVYK